ncbi:2-hydroxyacid dehydrogenase [Pseudorhodoferax sp.]|uniref:2-hydroxyacid dehydrogenase n=1 Tax=Pseudorhodoferax sp. TaxID=1993553 RepID=UPI0039E2E42A
MSSLTPHIFFSSTLDSSEVWERALARHLPEMVFTVGPQCAEPSLVDVVLVHKPPVEGFSAFTNLRAVISLSAGINQFSAEMLPRGVVLSRSIDPTLTHHMVAYAKTAVYRYHRRFHEFESRSRQGVWRFERPLSNAETTVGILGLGEIGSAIAVGLAADGFCVKGWSRSEKEVPGVSTYAGDVGLYDMVNGADIVVNVLPLTEATRHLLAWPLFKHFKRGTFLVNMGRGAHLVEHDLLSALEDGCIAAATLDVAQIEPLPAGHAFWAHPDILITPHIAGITSPESAAPQVAENIRRAMRGDALLNQVNFERGY